MGVKLNEIGEQSCPMAQAMAQIGDNWSLLILREAFYGRQRFSDFVERTGAQKSVVSARLKHLVDAGIMERTPYSEYPVRHNYVLTEKGSDLRTVILFLSEWGKKWADDGRQAGITYHHDPCDSTLRPVVHCAECGERLVPGSVSVRFDSRRRAAR